MKVKLVPKCSRNATRLQRKIKEVVVKPAARKPMISFAAQQRKNTWKSKCVVTISVSTSHSKQGIKASFDGKLIEMLIFKRKQVGGGKSDAVILPKPGSLDKARPIATAADIPNYIIRWRGGYV